jgi:hypothetical protein
VRGALGFSIQGEDQKRPLTPTLSPDDEAVGGEGDVLTLREIFFNPLPQATLGEMRNKNPLPQAQLGGEGRVRGALGFSIQGEDQKRPLTPTLSPDDEAVRGEGGVLLAAVDEIFWRQGVAAC